MVKQVNLYEAKTRLSKLVDEAAAGEEIVIAKNGKPLAALVPAERVQRQRKFGQWEGAVWEAPDCWNPDPEIEDLFENSRLFPDKPEE
jgi:prevent-host-death family protein